MVSIVLGVLVVVSTAGAGQPATTTAATPQRIGIYDSRAIAFVYFHSPTAMQQRRDLMAQAKATKKAGDTKQYDAARHQLTEIDRRTHLQVFSVMPADEAMAALAPKLPALRQELAVERFVSKWDNHALGSVAETNRVDVTDRLVREIITPTERQQKTLDAMKTTEPLPLWRAKLALKLNRM